jgi:hypothetical protein
MPDILGRYTLAEMREIVRRLIDGIRVSVDTGTGAESGAKVLDPLFSNEDINFFLNSAITMTFVDMNAGNEEVFEDEEPIDVTADICEYSLPDDVCQLRALWWKPPEIAYTIVPKQRRTLMHLINEPVEQFQEIDDGFTPSYHMRLNFIGLNEPERVKKDNPQGILATYIKWANYLDLDGDILETQFARIMQEVVVRRTAVELIEKKTKLDPAAMMPNLVEWTDRLMMVVRGSMNPATINMVTRNPWKRRGRLRAAGSL